MLCRTAKKIPLNMLGAACIALLFLLSPLKAQVAVIAHQQVPADTLTKAKLLDFYTGDSHSWGKGVDVVVFDLKKRGQVRNTFYKYLGKTSSRMKSIWLKRMLSGEGDPPAAVADEIELIEKVAATPGAIGFVDSAKVSDAVKTLVILPIPAR